MTEIDIVYKALELAGEWIRNNPPAYFPDEKYMEYVQLFADGCNRDPKGKEFVWYFLDQATLALKEREKDEQKE